jgi:hypothetical protein
MRTGTLASHLVQRAAAPGTRARKARATVPPRNGSGAGGVDRAGRCVGVTACGHDGPKPVLQAPRYRDGLAEAHRTEAVSAY